MPTNNWKAYRRRQSKTARADPTACDREPRGPTEAHPQVNGGRNQELLSEEETDSDSPALETMSDKREAPIRTKAFSV